MNWESWAGPLITVCTPTFNRAYCLDRVYQSLLGQSFKNFEWIVVDDGSTDDTAALVRRWQNDPAAFFPISYIYQPNQHKKVAFNRGVTAARGFFFICADSDDSFPASALRDFIESWCGIPGSQQEQFGGVVGLAEDEHGNLIGSRFPSCGQSSNAFDSDLQEIRYRYRVRGDKWAMTKTAVLREIRFPMEIEGVVPEGVIWSRIGARYRTRFVNKIVLHVHRARPGSGQSITTIFNPRGIAPGMLLYKKIVLTEEIHWFWCAPLDFLLDAARFLRAWLNSSERRNPFKYLGENPTFGWVLVVLMSPLGVLMYLVDILRIFARDCLGRSHS